MLLNVPEDDTSALDKHVPDDAELKLAEFIYEKFAAASYAQSIVSMASDLLFYLLPKNPNLLVRVGVDSAYEKLQAGVMGDLYRRGMLVHQDFGKSINYYTKSDNDFCIFGVSHILYITGKRKDALTLLEEHSNTNAECAYSAGMMYKIGDHVEKDDLAAFRNFSKCLDKYYPEAWKEVALYAKQRIVDVPEEHAEEYLKMYLNRQEIFEANRKIWAAQLAKITRPLVELGVKY